MLRSLRKLRPPLPSRVTPALPAATQFIKARCPLQRQSYQRTPCAHLWSCVDVDREHTLQQQSRMSSDEVEVETAPGVTLKGNLNVPPGAKGLVVFAHGSGSSRFSPRNRYVAKVLQEGGLSTFLFDLLTPREEEIDDITRELRFNIPFLADRMVRVTKWLEGNSATHGLNVGYFGASTGGGAAIVAAARLKDDHHVKAVVSRGGRPDLAGRSLRDCRVPTLLLVGGRDGPVIDMNKEALEQLRADVKELRIIPGASHLFEEPGKLEEVAKHACAWFQTYLGTTQLHTVKEER